MSDFYTKMAATASRLIGKYGQAMAIKRVSGGTIDPVTGATTAGTTTSYPVQGILQRYPDALIDGTRILTSDRLAILTPVVEPVITDKLAFGNKDWTIASIQTANPAGTPLVYFVQVRL